MNQENENKKELDQEQEFIMNFCKMFNEKYPEGLEPNTYINGMIKILIVFSRQHKLTAYQLIHPILTTYYSRKTRLSRKKNEESNG